jgi:hypothetical protein
VASRALRGSPSPAAARPAVGYVRVSTEEQSREGVSLAAQEARIRAFCTTQGLPLADVLVDAGQSASTLDRPALRDLLARIEAGTVGTVVVAKLDRLTRRTRGLLALVEDTFRAHHVELVSLSEQLDTRTPGGVLMLTMLGAVAQMERSRSASGPGRPSPTSGRAGSTSEPRRSASSGPAQANRGRRSPPSSRPCASFSAGDVGASRSGPLRPS